jgi:hypothetical protein
MYYDFRIEQLNECCRHADGFTACRFLLMYEAKIILARFEIFFWTSDFGKILKSDVQNPKYTEGSPKIDFFQMFNYLINLKSIFAH